MSKGLPRILLCEQATTERNRMAQAMKDFDILVTVAATQSEATEYLSRHEANVVIAALDLPEGGGFELAEWMKQHPRTKQTPIIFIVSYPLSADKVGEAYDFGAIGFLFRPVNLTMMLGQLGVFIELAEQRQQIDRTPARNPVEEEAWRQQRERVLEVSRDAVLGLTEHGVITEANTLALETLGFARENLIGRHIYTILYSPEEEDGLRAWRETPIYLACNGDVQEDVMDTVLWHAEGYPVPVDYRCAQISPLELGGTCCLIMFEDISMRKAEEEQRSQLSRYDALTGLANSSLMRHYLLKAMARVVRNDRQLAVIYLDIDDFRYINENFGPHAGDAVLKNVGRRLKTSVRTGDMVTRIEADGFIVILDEISDAAAAAKIAGDMLEKISTPHDLGGTPMVVHASAGIALYPNVGSVTIDALIDCAMAAMQLAKQQGKNQYRFYPTAVKESLAQEDQGRGKRGTNKIH